MPFSSSLRRAVIWRSGFTDLMDLLRRTVFAGAVDRSVERQSISRLTLMKVLHNFCMQPREIRLISRVLSRRGPCNLLVFGLGNDSTYWRRLNRGGRTVFLEDDRDWLARLAAKDPQLEAYLVQYGTVLSQWEELLHCPFRLQMYLPTGILDREWDVVLVDAPKGMNDDSPGRMKSIFIASILRAADADVFVHDCDREVESSYCARYLGAEHLREQTGRLNHYSYSGRKYTGKGHASGA